MLTPDQKGILTYLSLMRRAHREHAPAKWFYKGPADLLLREGKWFRPSDILVAGEPHACFRNAAMYAIKNKLRYIEGYAGRFIPVHHAWCADAMGNVHEVTWDGMGIAYFGVEFSPRYVMRGAVLFNPPNKRIYAKEVRP
jgi:hypothetical protein